MPLSIILVMTALAVYFAMVISVLIVDGIWVAPSVERHGARSAEFVAHWMLGTGLIRDYRMVRRLSRDRGIRVSWMEWSTWLLA